MSPEEAGEAVIAFIGSFHDAVRLDFDELATFRGDIADHVAKYIREAILEEREAATLEEREACAKLVETIPVGYGDRRSIATAIRARSKP